VLRFSNILFLLNPFGILNKKNIYFHDKKNELSKKILHLSETKVVFLAKVNVVK